MQINKEWVRKITEQYPFLHNFFTWNDGLDWKATVEEEKRTDKYILGAEPIKKVILQSNGDWTDYWPKDEMQKGKKIDSYSCTLFGLFNCLEALAKRKYGNNWNKSERFNAGMVKLVPPGYTLTGALDSVRKRHGAVDETTYPNNIETVSREEWIQDPPQEAIEQGKWWIENYNLYFVEVPPTLAGIRFGLQYSPIYCAGYAWYYKDGVYHSFGNPNHAFAIKRTDGNNLIVGDSYDPFEKKLAVDYKFYYPRFIVLEKKGENAELQKLISEGNKYLVRPEANGEWYKITDTGLEYKASIAEIADELNEYLKQSPGNINEMIKFLTQTGKVKWATEEYYNKLIT